MAEITLSSSKPILVGLEAKPSNMYNTVTLAKFKLHAPVHLYNR